MALRRLAREAMTPQLQPGCAAASCSSASHTPLGRTSSLLQNIWSRYSSPELRARAAEYGASASSRVALAVRPRLSGHNNLFKGLGIATVLTMTLQETAAAAEQALPFRGNTGSPSGSAKNDLPSLWPLVRKLQLPVGLILLIFSGWQNPLGLIVNILLLVFWSRPSRYSIYLFLQEMRHREMGQNHVVRKEEVLHTRKVAIEDYKFFSIATVELKDGRVLHLIGMLGSRWIYRKSCPMKREGDMGARNIGVAVDFSSCSKAALRWASTNLARNGDRIILIHVNNSYQNEQGAVHLWEQSGSPLIPLTEFSDPHVTKTYGVSPDKETIEILTQVAASHRGIEVFAKIIYGDPAKKLHEAVDLVPLNCLVIGSRGLSTLKRALMGSVSTYVVNHVACPVTVVKENM